MKPRRAAVAVLILGLVGFAAPARAESAFIGGACSMDQDCVEAILDPTGTDTDTVSCQSYTSYDTYSVCQASCQFSDDCRKYRSAERLFCDTGQGLCIPAGGALLPDIQAGGRLGSPCDTDEECQNVDKNPADADRAHCLPGAQIGLAHNACMGTCTSDDDCNDYHGGEGWPCAFGLCISP